MTELIPGVIGIVRILIIGRVTGKTLGTGIGKARDMAFLTTAIGMAAGHGKVGAVSEICIRPFCHSSRMTLPAIQGEASRGMIRIRGLDIRLQMAALTIYGDIYILPIRVTLLTIETGVNPDQRESRLLMPREHQFLIAPHHWGVALLARVLSKLPAMHVQMAILACISGFGEH